MNAVFNKIRSRAEKIKGLSLVILGTLTLAVGTSAFLIPFNLVSGGISGIAIIIGEVVKNELFGADFFIALLTWGAFLIGLLVLGKSFALKTLLSTALYPLFISLVGEIDVAAFLLTLFPRGASIFFASLLGGALVGLGLGLSFIGGGSTGGVDILALAICKRLPRLKVPRVILAIDAAVILLGAFVIADPKTTLLGILSAITAAGIVEAVGKS